jgi:hypothetical protein
MATSSITFTFPQDAFGKREHNQPLRKFKQFRRETGATFIIDLKAVDADGKLTSTWTGTEDQCREVRKSLVAVVRKFNAWKRNQPVDADDETPMDKVRPAATLQRVANVAPALQNAWNKVRKAPPAIKGLNTKRPRSPTPMMTTENFPALGYQEVQTDFLPDHAFKFHQDPYAGVPDDWTNEDYKNVENYLDDFTAQGWADEDCVHGECQEQLLEAEIVGTECDPAPNSQFLVANYYPETAMYDERGNLISLYHDYRRRVSWAPQLVRRHSIGAC